MDVIQMMSLCRKKTILTLLALSACFLLQAQESAGTVRRIGIIGLDTSHSTAFTQLLNSDSEDPYVKEFEITAAYPYGSRTIESSYKRIPGYIEEVKKYGVKICDSIEELLQEVDFVMIETNDGHPHLEQAAQVFASGKPCYIDKPLGATLGEAMAICELADRYGASVFSSSALRYSPETVKIRAGEYGPVLGADCYSPHHPEPTHPDFGFYGIHGVEILYTVMGPGCREVCRMDTEGADVVVGKWADGRIGTFRAVIGGSAYGGTVFLPKKTVQCGGYVGYKVLLDQILEYELWNGEKA